MELHEKQMIYGVWTMPNEWQEGVIYSCGTPDLRMYWQGNFYTVEWQQDPVDHRMMKPAHPLQYDMSAWRTVLAEREIIQPFPQAHRTFPSLDYPSYRDMLNYLYELKIRNVDDTYHLYRSYQAGLGYLYSIHDKQLRVFFDLPNCLDQLLWKKKPHLAEFLRIIERLYNEAVVD